MILSAIQMQQGLSTVHYRLMQDYDDTLYLWCDLCRVDDAF